MSVTSVPGAALETGVSEELKVVNDVFTNSKWSLMKQIFFLPNYSYHVFRDAGSLLNNNNKTDGKPKIFLLLQVESRNIKREIVSSRYPIFFFNHCIG